jgi:hypothetical protein
MKAPDELRAAALALAASRALPEDEVKRRLAEACDREYWRTLSPSIQISTRATIDQLPISSSDLKGISDEFSEERYFKMPPLVPAAALTRMNQSIDAVRSAGWPPAFALVSDDFWSCARLPAIEQLLTQELGPDHRQIPHVWLHIVRALDGASGWLPHFDGLLNNRLSVWLALTDATTENGCMFLIPPKLMPAAFRAPKTVPIENHDVMQAMHATRALPVPAGAALGWDFNVLHWGGRAVSPESERRALSLEFIAAGEPTESDEPFLVDPKAAPPPLNQRLRVIGAGMLTYAKFEPGLQRFRSLAEQLTRLD